MKMNYKKELKLAIEVIKGLENLIDLNEDFDKELLEGLNHIAEIEEIFQPCVYVIKFGDEYATKSCGGWTSKINKARIFSNPGHAKTSNPYKRNPGCQIVKVQLNEL